MRLSKVWLPPVPRKLMVPPLGASGLTKSKCLKSGGYLRSPKLEMPWLTITCGVAGASARAARGEEEEGGDDEQARGEQGLQPPVAGPGDREGPDAGSGPWSGSVSAASMAAN